MHGPAFAAPAGLSSVVTHPRNIRTRVSPPPLLPPPTTARPCVSPRVAARVSPSGLTASPRVPLPVPACHRRPHRQPSRAAARARASPSGLTASPRVPPPVPARHRPRVTASARHRPPRTSRTPALAHPRPRAPPPPHTAAPAHRRSLCPGDAVPPASGRVRTLKRNCSWRIETPLRRRRPTRVCEESVRGALKLVTLTSWAHRQSGGYLIGHRSDSSRFGARPPISARRGRHGRDHATSSLTCLVDSCPRRTL